MQADYTRKMQALAEERKQIEPLKQRADAYSRYEQYVPIIEEMLSSKSTVEHQASPQMAVLEQQLRAQGYDENAIDLVKMTGQFLLNQFQQERLTEKQQEQVRIENERLSQQIDEAEKLDPRLNDQTMTYDIGDGERVTFGELVSRLVIADSTARQNPVASTKRAIATVDALIGHAKTEGKQELSNSATQKAKRFPAINSSPQSATRNSAPTSIMDAYEETKKELGL